MRCCRKHVDAVNASARCGTTVDGIIIDFKYSYSLLVGIIIVVAVFWRIVNETIPEIFKSFEIGFKGLVQLIPCKPLVVINIIADRGENVGNASKTNPLYICCVVSRSAAVVILSIENTIFKEK